MRTRENSVTGGPSNTPKNSIIGAVSFHAFRGAKFSITEKIELAGCSNLYLNATVAFIFQSYGYYSIKCYSRNRKQSSADVVADYYSIKEGIVTMSFVV